MTQAYYTEDQKLLKPKRIPWDWDEQDAMRQLLHDKGYLINIVTRLGCDRQPHDAWEVQRSDIPQLIEQLFRQRIPVEVQPEGHGKASIIFVYDHSGDSVVSAVYRFQRNKGGKL